MSVKIVAAHLREKSDGTTFMTLEIHGDIELVQSQNTGKFYVTTRRCFLGSTLNQEEAQSLIGTKLKGSIVRMEVDPYEYSIPNSGEIIVLQYSWAYSPEESAETRIVAPEEEILSV